MMNRLSVIRVLLVDDHAIVRSGLAAFLLAYDDLQLIAEAEDGEEAVRLCERHHPDVVLMDMQMPVMDGATATRLIREKYPSTQVLILTSYKEDNAIHEALTAGAAGYILKNVTTEELASAIRTVYRGSPVLAPEAARVLMQAATQRNRHTLGDDLTEREHEVLRLMVRGQDNSQIADALVVSQATVKFHVSNILSKLHAASRTEAVVIALDHKLVPKQKHA
jgi:two-component system, NarL family, response regulator LiaR